DAQSTVRELIWQFYGDLKTYRGAPTKPRKAALRARFDRTFTPGARSAAVPAVMSAAIAATHSSASPRLAPSSESRSGITSAQDWLSQAARPSHTCRNWL